MYDVGCTGGDECNETVSTLLLRASGSDGQPLLHASGRQLLLTFRTDMRVASRGFIAKASCSPLALGCTDPEASNYDPSATTSSGACEYTDSCR